MWSETNFKIIITDNYLNKCKCGNIIEMLNYCFVNENGMPDKDKNFFMGYCKCGNIFLTENILKFKQ